jgi:hypothetical protein
MKKDNSFAGKSLISILDPYNVESENFLLTFFAPSPFPSPRWGEGGGEGKFQIFLARIMSGSAALRAKNFRT